MKATTIDQIPLKDHVRWAQDQQQLDPVFVTEASIVASHPEILGMSLIYPSRLEELLEMQKKNQHWASFSPPKNFHLFGKRFFSHRLFPNIEWEDWKDEEVEGGEPDLMQTLMKLKTTGAHNTTLFEKDRCTMLGMLESIQWINKLLKQINALKLQYQKG
jgi:hypothetical protein